jgi:seryl-tRNA synthetase
MLQVAYIKQNAELVKERLAVRNFKSVNLIDKVVALDEEIRQLKKKIEDAQMQINSKQCAVGLP